MNIFYTIFYTCAENIFKLCGLAKPTFVAQTFAYGVSINTERQCRCNLQYIYLTGNCQKRLHTFVLFKDTNIDTLNTLLYLNVRITGSVYISSYASFSYYGWIFFFQVIVLHLVNTHQYYQYQRITFSLESSGETQSPCLIPALMFKGAEISPMNLTLI